MFHVFIPTTTTRTPPVPVRSSAPFCLPSMLDFMAATRTTAETKLDACVHFVNRNRGTHPHRFSYAYFVLSPLISSPISRARLPSSHNIASEKYFVTLRCANSRTIQPTFICLRHNLAPWNRGRRIIATPGEAELVRGAFVSRLDVDDVRCDGDVL
jgi:hypothetical protein